MIITLKVSDETYEKYAERNRSNPRLAMEQTLERFKDFGATQRVVVLEDDVRKRLEKLVGKTFDDQASIVKVLEEGMSARINEVLVTLKPFQLRNLVAEAKALHKEFSEHAKQKLERVLAGALGMS